MCRVIISEPGFTYQDAAAATIDELVSIFEIWELTQLLGDSEKARVDALGRKEYYEEATVAVDNYETQKFLRQLALDNLDTAKEAKVAFSHLLAAINKSIR